MGRYASPVAFTATNPDYADISWVTDPVVTSQPWPEVLFWNQTFLADPWREFHIPGWIDNTRVMSWDHQVWLKSKSTGQWWRIAFSDTLVGHAAAPDFRTELWDGVAKVDRRTEAATGYNSIRLVYDNAAPLSPQFNYWIFHGYAGGRKAIDGPDIADIVVSQKTSLVVNNPDAFDDRDYARFLLACGADYYPPSGGAYVYPGAGTSRHKLVRAKWPNWQYHVMTSMKESEITATNGYPSVFVGLAEGDGGSPPDPGGGDGATPQPVAPTRGNWFTAVHDAGPPVQYAWEVAGVANVAESKIRRRRGNKIWS
jgi:hypothetical protein